MITSIASTLADHLRKLPEDGASRAIELQRLTDTCAAGEGFAALQSAADRASGSGGALSEALSAASALWDGSGFTSPADAAGARARRRLLDAVASPAFMAIVPGLVTELRRLAASNPGTGACTTATAIQLWTWTMQHFLEASPRPATALVELAEAFSWLLAARCQVLQLDAAAPRRGTAAAPQFSADLCHTQAARAAGLVATLCAELVFGYRRHLAWDAEGCASCYGADDLDELEGLIPGIASSARAHGDVVEADGSHAAKAGPCARLDGLGEFARLRARLDGCLTGARLAKDRAAAALPSVIAA